MRRKEKEIKDKTVIVDVLNTCYIGRLGTIGKDGYPMVKPLNFAYNPPIPPLVKGGEGGFGKIYFHTAKEGEKIEDIKRDNRVCFEVDLPIAYIKAKNNPCQADYLYRSVIIKGRAKIVEDREEKLLALNCLMEKHQPGGGYGDYTEDKLTKVGIVRIDIEEMRGKEDLRDGSIKEVVLKALKEKVPLPTTIERR
ncbi:MAG: pyridoxamine 5'-phosphate oxidase family protein [Nitrospinae bacterium]|nr:pyridoxamine 5'-phosphate oxidase family protein [Nitrospinota bacterium]